MAQLEHITPDQIAQYGVVAAPDRLTGRAQDNKAIFDRLVRELVASVVNDIIDTANELLTAEDTREENEAKRVEAELLRVEAENLREEAELKRVEGEEDRIRVEAQRVLAEGLRVEAENLRISAEQSRVTAEAAREAAEALRESTTNGIVAQATEQAQNAATDATTAESWAVGGTGTRPGENSNNANYWANVSQAEADRATIPAVDGVYNVILSDQVTLEKYALKVENGSFFVIGVSSSFKATDMTFVDQSTGLSYFLFVESGELFIKEIE